MYPERSQVHPGCIAHSLRSFAVGFCGTGSTFYVNANKNLTLGLATHQSFSLLKADFSYEIRLQRSPKFDIVAAILADTSFSHFEKSLPQPEIKVHLEIRFIFTRVLLDFQSFTEKPVFECPFAHSMILFLS